MSSDYREACCTETRFISACSNFSIQYNYVRALASFRGSSVKIGTMQRILAWRLRKDDTQKSRSVNNECDSDQWEPTHVRSTSAPWLSADPSGPRGGKEATPVDILNHNHTN